MISLKETNANEKVGAEGSRVKRQTAQPADALYQQLMLQLQALEQKLYLKMGKTMSELKMMRKAEKAMREKRALVLKRPDSLVDRQHEAVPLGSVPWWQLRQTEQWQSRNLINGQHSKNHFICLLYTSPSPRDRQKSRMPSSA